MNKGKEKMGHKNDFCHLNLYCCARERPGFLGIAIFFVTSEKASQFIHHAAIFDPFS